MYPRRVALVLAPLALGWGAACAWAVVAILRRDPTATDNAVFPALVTAPLYYALFSLAIAAWKARGEPRFVDGLLGGRAFRVALLIALVLSPGTWLLQLVPGLNDRGSGWVQISFADIIALATQAPGYIAGDAVSDMAARRQRAHRSRPEVFFADLTEQPVEVVGHAASSSPGELLLLVSVHGAQWVVVVDATGALVEDHWLTQHPWQLVEPFHLRADGDTRVVVFDAYGAHALEAGAAEKRPLTAFDRDLRDKRIFFDFKRTAGGGLIGVNASMNAAFAEEPWLIELGADGAVVTRRTFAELRRELPALPAEGNFNFPLFDHRDEKLAMGIVVDNKERDFVVTSRQGKRLAALKLELAGKSFVEDAVFVGAEHIVLHTNESGSHLLRSFALDSGEEVARFTDDKLYALGRLWADEATLWLTVSGTRRRFTADLEPLDVSPDLKPGWRRHYFPHTKSWPATSPAPGGAFFEVISAGGGKKPWMRAPSGATLAPVLRFDALGRVDPTYNPAYANAALR